MAEKHLTPSADITSERVYAFYRQLWFLCLNWTAQIARRSCGQSSGYSEMDDFTWDRDARTRAVLSSFLHGAFVALSPRYNQARPRSGSESEAQLCAELLIRFKIPALEERNVLDHVPIAV